jgi:putative transposase
MGNAGRICAAVGMARSSYYRLIKPVPTQTQREKKERARPRRAFSEYERQQVVDILHEERFVDKAPAEVYAKLLDEGRYHCSISTMYRILRSANEIRERRDQARHPNYTKPELLATAPNQVWSWDISKLKGPRKWNNYYLYVIIDIFSRYVVGWTVASRETAALAKELISETCKRQHIDQKQLTIHSDRGPSMTSNSVALLLADLGVTKSLNRPYVSNDNPYSEGQFKTLKYRPLFPKRFGSIQDARALCRKLFAWYNKEHYHSGIALMTPYMVHHRLAETCNEKRQAVLLSAYAAHPERFVMGQPTTIPLPEAAWINKPENEEEEARLLKAHALDCELRASKK